MVVCIRKLITFKWNTRIKNKIRMLPDQPGNMSMHQFCRIALGFAWNAVDTQFINLMRRLRGKDRAKVQLLKKYRPKRVVFINI